MRRSRRGREGDWLKATNQFTLDSTKFAVEFASFIDFIGADNFLRVLRKVDQKLGQLRPSVRTLFGDRYFFHEQCISFTDGQHPFQLDPSSFYAIRSASLIAGINRARLLLPPLAKARFRSMLLNSLKPNRDVRQIEHEIRCFIHFGQKGINVAFADLEEKGRFDLICEAQDASFDVECKTVSEDTGSQIKSEMIVGLCEAFHKSVHQKLPVHQSGIFVLTLKKPGDLCKNLASELKSAFESPTPSSFDGNNFVLSFVPRPAWHDYLRENKWQEIKESASDDPEIERHAHCVIRKDNCVLGLSLRPHKKNTLSERVIEVLKAAADQCSKLRPSLLWLHFIGFAENEFLHLAEFSIESHGGLNLLVAEALHPEASTTDRSHVQSIRFSSVTSKIATKPILDSNRLIVNSKSVDGACYDVPNPFCRFDLKIDY